MSLARLTALLLITLVDPELALAHAPIPGVGGFTGGFLHPALVPVHGLGLFGLGLLIDQQERRGRWTILPAFATALLAAVGAVASAFAFQEAGSIVLATACVAGILVAVARPVPWLVSVGLAMVTAAALVFDSVPETTSMGASLVELAGTGVGACLILAIVSAVAAAARRPWQRIGVRILGFWTAAAAMFVLALQFARM